MASQLDKVFTADPKSVFELFLSKGTVGFYIPAYQREYSWDENNIARLFEDICGGVCSLYEHEDAITFIGTIISILDTDHKTIKPYIHGELPSEVMSVIDGQQRLTTLSLLATCYYQKLVELQYEISSATKELNSWIQNTVNPVLNRLRQVLEIDRFSSDEKFRYYPKVTRSYADQWSTDSETAQYDSPIASYLFDFLTYIHSEQQLKPKEVFNYELSKNISDENLPKHERIIDNVKSLSKKIDLIINKGGDDTYRFPPIDDILSNDEIQIRLLDKIISKNLLASLENIAEGEISKFHKIIRLFILVNFFLDRVAVTSVVATNETYAFDMFEALNTTGEPLTAFETFKPKVIDLVGVKAYENSQERIYINYIDETLDKYKKAEDKQNATTRLLKPFRLALEGDSLSKHLSDQRRFLNKAFDSLVSVMSKHDFVKSMYETSIFLKQCWPEKKQDSPNLKCFNGFESKDLELCLAMLRDANHSITLGIFVRYFSEYNSSNQTEEDFNKFVSVVQAVTAFFVLWRSTRHGTDGIDNAYRDLMKNGHTQDGTLICKPICFSMNKGIADLPSVKDLQQALYLKLNDKFKGPICRDTYISRAKNIQTFKNNKALTRFMLLIASDDVVCSSKYNGLVEKGVSGSAPNFNLKKWEYFKTIEHIYPQSKPKGWADCLSEISSEHVIGNLLLLPQYINSSLGNRTWEEKKLILTLLCCKTEEKRNELIDLAKAKSIELSFSSESIAIGSKYMSHVEAASQADDWTNDFVNKRSENIYGLVWDYVIQWLK